MLSAVWLMLSTLLYSLELSTGSFPKPLSEAEEQHYLTLAQQGDLEARNVLIERNLRLVAHIMKNRRCKEKLSVADRRKHGARVRKQDCENLLECGA